ncbi:hypothetical protein GO495_14970 [Chitinophaga oryziterrae]|uniref:Uncharacterized protein n=1 Tax=Chitinophaga oryziterrae TaxID=1031224 RepID=A0A6N8J9I2_9BACT|nr:hypothetical protein [Chitinophaga oryziterrae]MVT41890.1 hypothetical protein [Chitinophaga oryziterrae]
MKRSFILFLLILLHTIGYGQFKTIAEGPEFKEPGRGRGKIFQLKNGNTVFIQIFTDEDDIEFRMYGPNHKQKVEKFIKPAYEKDKLKYCNALGMFENNGKITYLISAQDSKVPKLIRLIIDANTGELEKEEQLGELIKETVSQLSVGMYGNVPAAGFYFKKDENSNNYAIVLMNSFASDQNKRIEIVHYTADNKEISRSYYTTPHERYKYMRYLDMVVIGDEKVEVLARAATSDRTKGKDLDQELVLAELIKGSSKVELTELPDINMTSGNKNKSSDFYFGLMSYNPVTNRIMLISSYEDDDNEHHVYANNLITFDPDKKKIDKTLELTMDKVNEKAVELFGKKRPYTGAPQNIYINADGSYSIVFEAIRKVVSGPKDRFPFFYIPGHIAISNYDKTDKQTGSALMPADYFLIDIVVHPFSMLSKQNSTHTTLFGDRDEFKFFNYLRAKDKSYIMVNDVAENAEDMLKGDVTTIRGVGDCDAFYYDILDSDILPKRKFIFGQPERKKHVMHLPSIASYDAATNVYVTLKLDIDSKKYKLVWMQL